MCADDAPMAVADQQRVRLAYYAGITHVDDQVGRLLDALLSHNAERDTVTVLTADHAQNLGEANMWSSAFRHVLSHHAVV